MSQIRHYCVVTGLTLLPSASVVCMAFAAASVADRALVVVVLLCSSLLAPGEYKITFSMLPEGFVFTSQDIGDDSTDSDPDQSDGTTIFITLASGESNLTLDGGIIASTPPNTSSVPEPSALILAVVGLSMLCFGRRKQRLAS